MPVSYRLGPIKEAFIIGRGKIVLNETVIDEREVHDMKFDGGRFYIMSNEPTPHVIGSFPGNAVGRIIRDAPEAEETEAPIEGGGDGS